MACIPATAWAVNPVKYNALNKCQAEKITQYKSNITDYVLHLTFEQQLLCKWVSENSRHFILQRQNISLHNSCEHFTYKAGKRSVWKHTFPQKMVIFTGIYIPRHAKNMKSPYRSTVVHLHFLKEGISWLVWFTHGICCLVGRAQRTLSP